jgi:hypothetical protein
MLTEYEKQDLQLKKEMLIALVAIHDQMKRSNDTVDELNRLSEEESQNIELEFGDE